jgi:hypothetical protein
VLKEFLFVLEDASMQEIRIIYGIAQYIRDMGGLWMGILFMGFFFVKISNNDELLYQALASKYFRKPEVYKFAYAKKIDGRDLMKGKITVEEYNSLQLDSNMESMKQRTLRDLLGDIIKPTYFDYFKSFFLGMKTS